MAANVQLMCQYWKNFNLLELQHELDTTATELANRQDESEGSRKRLVDLSRDFKKNTPEDIRRVVAPLLKSFQLEVDSLSKRSKASEAAFLSVYKKLIDLPDPVPTLEHALSLQKKAQKVQDLEIENKQLRETLEEYNHEFAEVKNQEVTIKQLKEKLREHEERVEATAQSRAKEKERELQRAFAEKERQLQETQLSVAKKLGEAEQQIATLRGALESVQSELFEVKVKYDEATTAKSDEMEIVMADLERTNERAANAERQVERLKQQLSLASESLQQQSQQDTYQQNSSSDHAMDMLKRSALEVELATKEKEIAQLVEDVQRLQASLNKLRETSSAQVARLEEELSAKNQAFRFLENKLRTQEDYEEVKRELKVLKSIEFANIYQEGGHVEEGKSLEMLLLEKNKCLQTENTHLKVLNSGLADYGAGSTATPKFTTTTTTTTSSSTTKKSDRSPSLTPSSSLSPLLPSSMSSLSFASAMAISASAPPVFTRHLSMPSSRTYMPEVTTSRSISSEAATSFPMLSSSATAIKQEFSSPVSSAPCALPISFASDMDNILHHRTPCILSSGRQSPANCKLSPDSLISPHSASTNSGRPLSPITSLPSLMDPRHFAPPLSPFYAFPGGPFHSAFMPLNMVKSEISSTSGVLDTGYVAKTVRELLSIHNIGQRLFAKHVLGLSQGTVSELLSKPKSWDKLTEKGRESYRKMHAWATDDANIMALKAISPKKGIHPITSNNSYKEKEDLATEERIANILSEAQVAMHMKKTLEQQQVANAVVSSLYHHEMSKMGGKSPGISVMSPSGPPLMISNGQHYPGETPRTKSEIETRHSANSSQDEAASAQEMVARIYRQELEKLKKAADSAGNIAASAMYAQELDRLNLAQHPSVSVSSSCQPPAHPFLPSPSEADCSQSSPLALDCRTSRPSGLKLKTEPPDSTSDETVSQITNCGAIDLSKPCSQTSSTPSSSPSSDSGGHVASAFVLVHSRLNGHDSRISESAQAPPQKQPPGGPPTGPSYGAAVTSESLSPLQKMQNIANSFTSRPNSGLSSSKPLRAVLPPITQEEFDRFANMNTDDLVKKVKETLSQYSISQRLFGESVLGLSQGSVSDLLARPKPWHMLTQKGREPFIRMQLFLEDADSIPKLVASQYRIPPDKLMRSNSRGSTEAEPYPFDLPAHTSSQGYNPPLPPQLLPAPKLPPLLTSHPPHLSLVSPSLLTPASLMSSTLCDSSPLPMLSPSHLGTHPHQSLPHLPLTHSISLPLSPLMTSPMTPSLRPPCDIFPSLSRGPCPPGLPLSEHFPNTPNSGDLAALHNIWGTFAFPSSMLEVIAMTSEIDTLSLTSRVKDVLQFHNLGQKLFGEAVLGLSQGSVSELLSKPKPWYMLSIKGREPFIKMYLWLGNPQNVEHLKLFQTQMKAQRRRKSSTEDKNFESPTQPKRPRVFFTEDQKDSLRQAYNQDPYPNQNTIEALAKSLNVGVKTVINWFHNHRMRAKQQHHAAGDAPIKAEPDESSNQSDVSSLSSDITSGNTQMGQLFHGGIAPADVNQWIFPQFEPMALKRKVPSALEDNEEDNKENNGGLDEDEDDEMDEPDGFDATSGSHNNNNNNIGSAVEGDYNATKRQDSEDGDSDKVVGEANQKWVRSRDDSFDGAGAAAITSASNSSSSSANRRKRSNPQRIFEGAQIDWAMMGSSDKAPGSSGIREEIVDEGPESVSGTRVEPHSQYHNSDKISSCNSHVFHEADEDDYNNEDNGRFSGRQTCSQSVISYHSAARHNQNEASVHRIRKIEKIKKSISSLEENWDDEEDETVSSIEKIQKHIEAKSNEDWEF